MAPDDRIETVSVSLPKGGVGKTTLSINLADRLADRGHDVLLVDLVQQGGSAKSLDYGEEIAEPVHAGTVLSGNAEAGTAIRSRNDDIPFDLLPSHRSMNRQLRELGEETAIRTAIEGRILDPLADEYDWVVFDSPPLIGPISSASLLAGQRVVVPLLMSEPSLKALTELVTEQLLPLNGTLVNREVQIVAIVPNRISGDNEERRILRTIEESDYGKVLPSFARTARLEDDDSMGPGIRERIEIRRAAREGVPLGTYDPGNDMLPRFEALASIVEEHQIRR